MLNRNVSNDKKERAISAYLDMFWNNCLNLVSNIFAQRYKKYTQLLVDYFSQIILVKQVTKIYLSVGMANYESK